MDADAQRLQRDVEDLLLRVRALEAYDTPYYRQLLSEFRVVQKRVTEFAEQGTPSARRDYQQLNREMAEVKRALEQKADSKTVDRIDEELDSNRRMVRTALIAAALSLGGTLVAFFIERAITK